jgi:hypothetical protein
LTIPKLHNTLLKNNKSYREAFWNLQEHWRRVDPRVVAGEDQQTGGSGSSPSSLPARTGGGSPSHLQGNPTNRSSRFHFCFPLFLLDLPLSPFINPFFFWVQRRHCLLPSEWLKMGEDVVVASGVFAHTTMGLRGNRLKGLTAAAR